MGTPVAASYAIPLRIGGRWEQLTFEFVQSVQRVVDEMFACLELIEAKGPLGLVDRITNEDYRRNFTQLVRSMAPSKKIKANTGLTVGHF